MKKIFGVVLLGILLLNCCTVTVNFKGASIHPDAQTISIDYFPNRAPLGMPNLGQYFTDELRDKYISDTRLELIESDGDLSLEGEITGYTTRPIAIQGDETAAQNRLTITVKVTFVNEIESKYNFESSFSRYADYSSDRDLSSVEAELVEEITEQLLDDIFNKSVVNW